MKIRPYLTFSGQCFEAVELYKRAFKTEVNELVRFSDLPESVGFPLPDEYREQILQTTLNIGDNYIRLSDCGPGAVLNDPQSERVSLVIETDVDSVKFAFEVLAEEGKVGIPLLT